MKKWKKNTLLPVYCVVLTCFLLIGLWSSKVITTLSENMPIEDRKVIVVDAGHGGVDGGAVSCVGLPESNYNLAIAIRLNDLLHLLGIETVMIRSTDCSIYTSGETIAAKKVSDLRERVRIVNSTKRGFLVSIHQNYYSDSRYSGGQVFYPKNGDGVTVAKMLQEKMRDTINPGSNRQAKQAKGVYLMEHIQRPGILIECGFLSNPVEEAKLRSPLYQKKLCAVIASVCSQYLHSDNQQLA